MGQRARREICPYGILKESWAKFRSQRSSDHTWPGEMVFIGEQSARCLQTSKQNGIGAPMPFLCGKQIGKYLTMIPVPGSNGPI